MAILHSDKMIKNIDLPACKYCIHYKPSMSNFDYTSTFNKCGNFGEKDIISNKINYRYADICRNDEYLCGNEGKYFKEDPNITLKIMLHLLISTTPITLPVFIILRNILLRGI